MKEPNAENLACISDLHLELLIDCYAFELKRRNPRRAEQMADSLKRLMSTKPKSSAEPFPHMEAV